MCQESLEGGEQRFICEPSLSGLGDAEINHLRHGHVILRRQQRVRGFDVAMDDAFLMRVRDRAADLDEQVQTLSGGELVLIAVNGDLDAADQFHHEVRPAGGKLRVQGWQSPHLALSPFLPRCIPCICCQKACLSVTT